MICMSDLLTSVFVTWTSCAYVSVWPTVWASLPIWRRTFSIGRFAVDVFDFLRCREQLTLFICLWFAVVTALLYFWLGTDVASIKKSTMASASACKTTGLYSVKLLVANSVKTQTVFINSLGSTTEIRQKTQPVVTKTRFSHFASLIHNIIYLL